MMDRVKAYYRINEQISKVYQYERLGYTKLCEICFEPECDHKPEEWDSPQSAIEQLQWWQGIALTEGSTFVNEDYPVPRWLTGSYNPFLTHRVYEIPENAGEVMILFNRNKTNWLLNIQTGAVSEYPHSAGSGFCYGYSLESGFYGMATFDNGIWAPPDRNGAEFKLVPEFTVLSGNKEHWYIPTVEDHTAFMDGLVCQ